jgi:nitrogen fixation/metabolism regulation signal transduction histidine kinase
MMADGSGTRGRRIGLATRFGLTAIALAALAVLLALAIMHAVPNNRFFAAALAIACVAPLVFAAMRAQLRPVLEMFRALGGTVISYRDGDYSFSLHWDRDDEMRDLIEAHNALGALLREQRLELAQRELLLDTMVQNTPVAMLLVCIDHPNAPVVFANLAARQLLNGGKRLEGHTLGDLLDRSTPALRAALGRGGDGLFTASRHGGDSDDEDDIFHLARRQFSLNGRRHELLLLRHLTAELRRQEVHTWKKVIRVITHELNNSLAPAASLAHSGVELMRRGQTERLPEILQTIEDRARHLERFIEGYARFAKLPAPRIETVAWGNFVAALAAHIEFKVAGALPEDTAAFDIAQMEQALLNILKNAHESGSRADDVLLSVRRMHEGFVIEVVDRGCGMSETVMSSALVPFYSTKRSGTGLGLALAREIVEAHGGRIALGNREGGGLSVILVLPGIHNSAS